MVVGGNLDPTPGEAYVNGPSPGSRITGNAQNLWIGAAEEKRRRGRSCCCACGAQTQSRPWPTPSCPRRGTSTGIPAAATPTTPDTGGLLQVVTARQLRGT